MLNFKKLFNNYRFEITRIQLVYMYDKIIQSYPNLGVYV